MSLGFRFKPYSHLRAARSAPVSARTDHHMMHMNDMRPAASQKAIGHRRVATSSTFRGRLKVLAVNGPQRVRPGLQGQDKVVQVVVEAGIRGCLALAAAHALHLDLAAGMSGSVVDVLHTLPAAAPLIAMDAAIAAASSSTASSNASHGSSPTDVQLSDTSKLSQAMGTAVYRQIAGQVQQHMQRYQLTGSCTWQQQLLLEVCAQASEELLARGVLLGGLVAWLNSRALEADLPDSIALGSATVPLASISACCAAAAICMGIGSRYAYHAKQHAAGVRSRVAAANALAAQQARIRSLQPATMAVSSHSPSAAAAVQQEQQLSPEEQQQVAFWVHALLGLRFVGAQAACYAAYIGTGSFVASFAVGLLLQISSAATMDQPDTGST